jgi:hypothetical protein
VEGKMNDRVRRKKAEERRAWHLTFNKYLWGKSGGNFIANLLS